MKTLSDKLYNLNSKLRDKVETIKKETAFYDFENFGADYSKCLYADLRELLDDFEYCRSHYIMDADGNYLGGDRKLECLLRLGKRINDYLNKAIRILKNKTKKELENWLSFDYYSDDNFRKLIYDVYSLRLAYKDRWKNLRYLF